MKQKTLGNRKRIRIAIAEDHQMMRDMLVENINSMDGCNVVFAAENGLDLLNELEKASVLPDICVLDISMPKLNGYDTQKAITKRWPGIKTLAVSIYDDKFCIAEMLKYGANGFIPKSSRIEILEDALLSIYEYGRYPAQKTPKDLSLQTSGLPKLTEREKEYLTLTCAELSVEEIAQQMSISNRTLDRYREKVYQKTNVNSKADLIFYVKKTGIVYMKY